MAIYFIGTLMPLPLLLISPVVTSFATFAVLVVVHAHAVWRNYNEPGGQEQVLENDLAAMRDAKKNNTYEPQNQERCERSPLRTQSLFSNSQIQAPSQPQATDSPSHSK